MSETNQQPESPQASREIFVEHLAAAIISIDLAAATPDAAEAEMELCWARADLDIALDYVSSAPAALAELWGDQG
jgi:hypothetical protein